MTTVKVVPCWVLSSKLWPHLRSGFNCQKVLAQSRECCAYLRAAVHYVWGHDQKMADLEMCTVLCAYATMCIVDGREAALCWSLATKFWCTEASTAHSIHTNKHIWDRMTIRRSDKCNSISMHLLATKEKEWRKWEERNTHKLYEQRKLKNVICNWPSSSNSLLIFCLKINFRKAATNKDLQRPGKCVMTFAPWIPTYWLKKSAQCVFGVLALCIVS